MKSFRFSIYSSVFFLILSALLHSISFIVKPEPANDTEKQLLDLMNNYKMDMGAGFIRSFQQIFLSLSACFTLVLLFGGVLLYYLYKWGITKKQMTGVLNIYLLIYGILLVIVWTLTFLPPILCVTFVFIALAASRWTIHFEDEQLQSVH
jgi:hypothetical protein